MTLYSIVVGKVPFHDENILALYSKIKTQKLEFPDGMDLSPEVIHLVSQMLIKDPTQRITLDEIKVREDISFILKLKCKPGFFFNIFVKT